jgi:ribonuclease HII
MVVCGVLLDGEGLKRLAEIGVRDSKVLAPKRRRALADLVLRVARKHHIIEITPAEIDRARERNQLNELEARVFARVIDRLRPSEAFVDSVDADPSKFRERLSRYLRTRPKLVVENFADQRYVQVAAASIVAKVRRDERIAGLRARYGDFGSGYPADPKTRKFLRRWLQERGSLPHFVRKSWKTLQHL